VKAPCEAAVEPMFKPALKGAARVGCGHPPVFCEEKFPKSSTIVMPGNMLDPNVLMPNC